MAEPQYDVSVEKRRILEDNAKRRLVLRNEFLKQVSDPFRHAKGEGGTVFDSAMQRYNSMRVSYYEHFKPNVKSLPSLLMVLVPMGIYSYILYWDRKREETKRRNGEIAYKDRLFKFI